MSNVKLILTAIVAILGAFIALAAIGMIITAVKYLFWLGVICIAGMIAVKLFRKSEAPQIESKSHNRELDDATRTLKEYKRKLLTK